jgi:chromosomal replication initiator protein
MTPPPPADATFESLAVGKANEVAWTAARTFASAPLPVYNPLFIRGGSGVGKTHLLRAIAAEHERRAPGSVRFHDADELVIGYTAALRAGTSAEFELGLRGTGLLLVDGLDVLGPRPATQEMLRRCVSAVLEAGGRVVFAAERPPHDLENFCPRLLSIAAGGLVVDVNPPDLELRLAIVKNLAATHPGVALPDEVAMTLARRLVSVRLLQGAFSRLVAYAEVQRRRIDVDYTRDLLEDLFRAQRRFLSIDEIQTRVSDHFHIRKAEMTSARRSRDVARPRQVAMYLSKQLTPRSLPEIGRRFGGRDHTTVIHAIKQIERLRISDGELDRDVRSLERELLQ